MVPHIEAKGTQAKQSKTMRCSLFHVGRTQPNKMEHACAGLSDPFINTSTFSLANLSSIIPMGTSKVPNCPKHGYLVNHLT